MSIAPIQVLVVDDEPLARSILEGYIAILPQLELIGSCANAIEALEVLQARKTDLLLLDIDMPQLSGLGLLNALPTRPRVIFTTAHPQHALESYEYGAIDYLLKPIRLERFLKAIQKLSPPDVDMTPTEATANNGLGSELMFVKSEGRLVKIDLSEVLYIEGLKDYVVIHQRQARLVIHSTMKSLEERLAANPLFLRIHKSYIANLRLVSVVDGAALRIGQQVLTIGATYRENVYAILELYKLV